ncbi:hypothetical protein O6H91_03G110300 [Diphasiastrum complanatum]|uniref:Uncharacterized protein n=1 Tax=Diphasiastrum complanatum TaxID=34168 RepID=A0ACC2EA23_DIPCM|nr:hypothetical protein O6H91_Y184500 [Diphasiastrum complanatum]KAJ7563444.1 hypothetical protein O6H91_03G110300 [Diphasiastrum complanatum]
MELQELQPQRRQVQLTHAVVFQERLSSSQLAQGLAAPRSATPAEEEWLTSQDQLSQAQEHWLRKQSESIGRDRPGPDVEAVNLQRGAAVRENDSVNTVEKEAEEFDRNSELIRWVQAQEQKMVLVEAEDLFAFEQENVLDDARCYHNYEENARRSHMCNVLQKGDDCVAAACYEELVSVRHSARQLLEIVDRQIHFLIERERKEAREELEAAWEFQKNVEAAANRDRTRLQEEIYQLQQGHEDLLELLEQERDRNICRICFNRPRDVLSLPCMHFDYCFQCLEEHQKTRNHCPTCRSSISGTLVYKLSMG